MITNNIRRFIFSKFVGFVLLVGCFSGIVYFALIEPQLPTRIRKPLNQPDFVFEKVRLSFMDQGIMNWEMDSSRAVVVNDQMTQLYEVQGRFYRNDMVVASLTSPIGTLNLLRSDMLLQRAEVVFRGQGRPVTLNADVLQWKSDSSQLEGRGHVTIQSGGLELTGRYFLVDVMRQLLVVSANSSARITQ